MFLRSVNINNPAPWCAAFVNYVLQEAKVPHKMNGLALSCCPADGNLIYSRGKRSLSVSPKSGDLFFWFRPGGGHTGFIKDWPSRGDYFTTIEGNVTTSDGRQGVAVKTRKKSSVQKIYSASALSIFSSGPSNSSDTIIPPDKKPGTTKPKDPPNTNSDSSPPYFIFLIIFIVLILRRKGYFQF